MDKKTLIARLRQLETIDKNAFTIYTDLSELAQDSEQKEIFSDIANDEKRHVALSKEMLSLLEE